MPSRFPRRLFALALWAAVGLVALIATAMWSILARRTGIYVTSGISYTAWGWVAITGGDVAMLVGGDTVWVRETTASIQFIATALAIISLVVFSMRLMGAYPSPSDNAAEEESETSSSNRRSRS